MSAFSNFSEGTASIIGGLMAVISLRVPLIAEAVVIFFSIFVALSLYEPKRKIADIPEGHVDKIWKTVKYVLHENKQIKNLMLYASFVGTSTFVFVWLAQPYWKSIGIPLVLFGVIWAALQFVVGYFSIIASRVEKVLGRNRLMITFVFLIALGYCLIGSLKSLWAASFIVIFYIVRGLQEPLLKAYIHELVPSQMRATSLSINSFLRRFIFVVLGPFIGWFADVYSLHNAFLLSASIFFVAGSLSLGFFFYAKRK